MSHCIGAGAFLGPAELKREQGQILENLQHLQQHCPVEIPFPSNYIEACNETGEELNPDSPS